MRNIRTIRRSFNAAMRSNSEVQLLSLLKDNSFMFYDLFHRKYGVQPVFREISFGGGLRCDFAWLNDNSDGPEWTLVEVEAPNMRLFNASGKPSKYLTAAIDQVQSWRRYFDRYPAERTRIFGAVMKFRYIIVAGTSADWSNPAAMRWRADFNKNNPGFEIRTMSVFDKVIDMYRDDPDEFWSFDENPATHTHAELQPYWEGYGYMNIMRNLFAN